MRRGITDVPGKFGYSGRRAAESPSDLRLHLSVINRVCPLQARSGPMPWTGPTITFDAKDRRTKRDAAMPLSRVTLEDSIRSTISVDLLTRTKLPHAGHLQNG
jgi:hypothetical protein